jgi:hypothetical protein
LLGERSLGKVLGKQCIANLGKKLAIRIQQARLFQKHFASAEYPVETHVARVMSVVFFSNRYFKQTDLRLIHEKLGTYKGGRFNTIDIDKGGYDNFMGLVESILREMEVSELVVMHALKRLLWYRECICR